MRKPRYISLQPFVPWREQERPIDWREIFGREGPLEVEIGFGNGEHLVRMAQRYPESNLIGIESSWESTQRALRRLAQVGIPNVRLLQIDARTAFDRLFREKSVDRVYALYPCPWPKERHVKHRLFSKTFLQRVNNRLSPQGRLQIVTDHPLYAEWIVGESKGCGFGVDLQKRPARFGTKYERKWQKVGQEEFFEITLVKQKHLPSPIKEDIPLKTYSLKHFDAGNFKPKNVRNGVSIDFKDFIYDPQRRKAMVLVVAVEENLVQTFWIEIVKKDAYWRIRPAKGSAWIPTAAVQSALDATYQAAVTA